MVVERENIVSALDGVPTSLLAGTHYSRKSAHDCKAFVLRMKKNEPCSVLYECTQKKMGFKNYEYCYARIIYICIISLAIRWFTTRKYPHEKMSALNMLLVCNMRSSLRMRRLTKGYVVTAFCVVALLELGALH